MLNSIHHGTHGQYIIKYLQNLSTWLGGKQLVSRYKKEEKTSGLCRLGKYKCEKGLQAQILFNHKIIKFPKEHKISLNHSYQLTGRRGWYYKYTISTNVIDLYVSFIIAELDLAVSSRPVVVIDKRVPSQLALQTFSLELQLLFAQPSYSVCKSAPWLGVWLLALRKQFC